MSDQTTETKKKKAKLHEILAVEGDLRGQAEKILAETKTVFSKKANNFMGSHRTLKMVEENRAAEEEAGAQYVEMVTTVPKRLTWTAKTLVKYVDLLLQKEKTNQTASADLVIDDVLIAEQVPAMCLLALEDRMKKFRTLVCDEIPTLAPGKKWVKDDIRGKDVWKSEIPEVREKTEQVLKPFVMYEATDKHPAQVEKLSEHKVVGTFTTDHWSGMLSPAQKAELIERVDKTIRAIKRARQRANQAEVIKEKMGKALFDYVLGDL